MVVTEMQKLPTINNRLYQWAVVSNAPVSVECPLLLRAPA